MSTYAEHSLPPSDRDPDADPALAAETDAAIARARADTRAANAAADTALMPLSGSGIKPVHKVCTQCHAPFTNKIITLDGKEWLGATDLCPECDAAADAEAERLRRFEELADTARTLRAEYADVAAEYPLIADSDPEAQPEPHRTALRLLFAAVARWKHIRPTAARVAAANAGRKIGLAITGETRRGKTRAMFALYTRLMTADLIRATWIDCASLFSAVSAIDFDDQREVQRTITQMETVPVLFLDDLGKGDFTSKAAAALFRVINNRVNAARPIIFTSNYRGEPLTAVFRRAQDGEAVVARLREHCSAVNCNPLPPAELFPNNYQNNH